MNIRCDSYKVRQGEFAFSSKKYYNRKQQKKKDKKEFQEMLDKEMKKWYTIYRKKKEGGIVMVEKHQNFIIGDIVTFLKDFDEIIEILNTTKQSDGGDEVYSILFKNNDDKGLYTFTMTFGDLRRINLRE